MEADEKFDIMTLNQILKYYEFDEEFQRPIEEITETFLNPNTILPGITQTDNETAASENKKKKAEMSKKYMALQSLYQEKSYYSSEYEMSTQNILNIQKMMKFKEFWTYISDLPEKGLVRILSSDKLLIVDETVIYNGVNILKQLGVEDNKIRAVLNCIRPKSITNDKFQKNEMIRISNNQDIHPRYSTLGRLMIINSGMVLRYNFYRKSWVEIKELKGLGEKVIKPNIWIKNFNVYMSGGVSLETGRKEDKKIMVDLKELKTVNATWQPPEEMIKAASNGRSYKTCRNLKIELGGLDDDGRVRDDIKITFTKNSNKHMCTTHLMTARYDAEIIVYKKRAYVIGGRDSKHDALDSTEIIELETLNVRYGPTMNYSRGTPKAVLLVNTIMVMGGTNHQHSELIALEESGKVILQLFTKEEDEATRRVSVINERNMVVNYIYRQPIKG